jgi:hypothetical protein
LKLDDIIGSLEAFAVVLDDINCSLEVVKVLSYNLILISYFVFFHFFKELIKYNLNNIKFNG